MSGLRRLERGIIKAKCYDGTKNGNNFSEEWKAYRKLKFGESIPVDTTVGKKYFMDSKDKFINALRYQKMKIQEFMAQKRAEKETEAKVNEAVVTE